MTAGSPRAEVPGWRRSRGDRMSAAHADLLGRRSKDLTTDKTDQKDAVLSPG
jgi:hypothetical protein